MGSRTDAVETEGETMRVLLILIPLALFDLAMYFGCVELEKREEREKKRNGKIH